MALEAPSPMQATADRLPAGIPMSVAVSVCEGPEAGGPKWACIVFSDLLFSMSVRLPLDQMDDLADRLPEQMRAAVAEGRRQTAGIVLPGEVAHVQMPPVPQR